MCDFTNENLIMVYPHISALDDLVNEGAVGKSRHPIYPLWIYNYTPKALYKYGEHWPTALSEARGLVLDENGHVIARAFPKFWNLNQADIKDQPFTITEKMDGSMILVFLYRGSMVVATRGSFMSAQAQIARDIIAYKGGDYTPHRNATDVYELIDPGNRIVVHYGPMRDLVYLTTFDRTGKEHNCGPYMSRCGWPVAEKYQYSSILDAIGCKETQNREGFVVCWQDGTRHKIKFEDYKRLHRAVFGTSEWTVWDMLRNTMSYKIGVSVEYDQWCGLVASRLVNKRKDLNEWVLSEYARLSSLSGVSRKDFALSVQGNPWKSALFLLLDGKLCEYEAWLWKRIEPSKDTLFRKETQYE